MIAGLISKRLQGHDEITVFTPEMLRKTLEKGGQAGRNALNLIESVLDDIETIGCEEQGCGTFFAKHKRIPVILIGDAVGENVHQLVDVLLNSLFEWQHDHADQPLTITIDEMKRMSFRDGSPLHTVMTQGRRYRMEASFWALSDISIIIRPRLFVKVLLSDPHRHILCRKRRIIKRKGESSMKEKTKLRSSFSAADKEQRRKVVTQKIQKLVTAKTKKAG